MPVAAHARGSAVYAPLCWAACGGVREDSWTMRPRASRSHRDRPHIYTIKCQVRHAVRFHFAPRRTASVARVPICGPSRQSVCADAAAGDNENLKMDYA